MGFSFTTSSDGADINYFTDCSLKELPSTNTIWKSLIALEVGDGSEQGIDGVKFSYLNLRNLYNLENQSTNEIWNLKLIYILTVNKIY